MTPTTLHLPIPRAILDEKRLILAAAGFSLPNDSGTGTFRGIDFTYSYSDPTSTLTLTITKKPNLMPMGMIKRQLAKWVGVEPVENN